MSVKNPDVLPLEEYVGANTKIRHRCLIHNVEWHTTPSRALQGQGCKKCHGARIRRSKTRTHEWYIGEVDRKGLQIKVLGEYSGVQTKIEHICLKHNVTWMASPENVLNGRGCQMCRDEKISAKNSKPYEQYVEELQSVNPDIECIGEYSIATRPALHRCKIDGHTWMNLPSQILGGRGCPVCGTSHGERQVRLWLETHNILYEEQKTFDGCKDIKCLPFDFYLPILRCAIEYDGEQHYRPVDFFGGEEGFKNRQLHDKIKTQYCDDNGIRLIRIPYNKSVEQELNNTLFV